jgi:hypothetical protein
MLSSEIKPAINLYFPLSMAASWLSGGAEDNRQTLRPKLDFF